MHQREADEGDVQVSDYGNVVIDDGIAIFNPVEDLAGLDLGEI
jgi:hypothetical protein